MKNLTNILFLLILSYGYSFSQETFPVNGVADNFKPIYVFTNAHIIVSSSKEIKNGTLMIQNGIILSVDSTLEIPNGAIVYDLDGDYIYPSFIDLYSDYGLQNPKTTVSDYRPQYESNKKGAYNWNQAIHPEKNAVYAFQHNNKRLLEYLKMGFGSLASHSQDGIFRGTGLFALLSNSKENKDILEDNIATFYSFKKGTSKQRYPTSLMGSIALIKQTLLDAEWHENTNGNSNISLSAYNSTNELPKIFALNTHLDYSRLFNISDEFEIDFIAKGNGSEFLKIKEIKKTGFPIIVPINFPKAYDVTNPEEAMGINLSNLKNWETAPFNLKILAENDITFSITASEIKNKSDFIKNLRLAVSKGLSQSNALDALTITPAKLIGVSNKLGTLEKNKIANFIICSSNIFIDGKIYENWSSGKKHVIIKKANHDFRGYYSFNSQKLKNLYVEIKGTKKNPIAKIPKIDSLISTIIIDEKIIISNKSGSFKSVGKMNNNKIEGSYQDSLGVFYHFTMTRDSVLSKNKKSVDLETDTITPSIWQPNKSNGLIKKITQKTILFKNATLWTNEEIGIVNSADIVISNGKIVAIGKDLDTTQIPNFENLNIEIADATGKHITSGIIDEHSHIAISKGVNESSQAVTSEVSIADVINPDDHNIYRQIAGGVTCSQLLHGSANPIGGQSALVKLRWGSSAEDMKIENCDGFIKFALGENVKQSNWGSFNTTRFPQTRMGVEQVFFDAFYRAKNYKKEWSNYNKLSIKQKRERLPPREDLELNTLVEILDGKRHITCHSYIESEINMLMHVADSMGFHINTFTHILEGYKIADKLKKHGAGASTFSDWWAYKFEVNDAIPYNAAILNQKGVLTAINSDDAEMGRRLNQEAAKAVKYGNASEEDAWKMITLNPAKLLHLDNRMGSLKVGKDADIVVWSENPLSIYAKVEQTYIDGNCYFDLTQNLLNKERDNREKIRIIKKLSKRKEKSKTKYKPTKEKLYHCDSIEHE